MARKTKEDSEKTRDMLLDAAENLFLAKGVAKTSLEQIARAAGVTRGALYWHFKDKEDVFHAMHQRVKLPFDAMFQEADKDADPVAALRKTSIQLLLNIVEQDRVKNVVTILLFRSDEYEAGNTTLQRNQKSRDEAMLKFKNKFERIHTAGKLQPHLTPATATLIWHAAIVGILTDYLRNETEYDLRELAPLFVDAVLKGLIV